MDYGLLAPEINSTRLYTGPGSAPMMVAAQAWDTLSRGLYSTAAEFGRATTAMTWTGLSAEAMRGAATAYAAWLTATAATAESTAAQAASAAVAYETAYAATVAPQLVAANRALLVQLAATNVFGQNTAAIAATEAQYAEMWAQDAAAMYSYQAASAAATQLGLFTSAPQTARPLASTAPASITGVAQQVLSGLLGTATPADLLNGYAQAFLSSGVLAEVPLQLLSLFSVLWAVDSPGSSLLNTINGVASAEAAATPYAAAISAPAVQVSVGASAQAGQLSVPRQWWANPPAPARAPAASPLPAQYGSDMPVPIPLPLGGVTRGGTPPKRERSQPEYGGIVRFVPRPPAGG